MNRDSGLGMVIDATRASFSRESFQQDVGYQLVCEGRSKPVAFVRSLYGSIVGVAKVAVCACVGHKLVDSGYGGPDSGCIDIGCSRCGFSYPTHHLY